jgi:hypothetical protein
MEMGARRSRNVRLTSNHAGRLAWKLPRTAPPHLSLALVLLGSIERDRHGERDMERTSEETRGCGKREKEGEKKRKGKGRKKERKEKKWKKKKIEKVGENKG